MTNYPFWAASVVWYEIFPDRFCKGNVSNPISKKDILGTTPWGFDDLPWEISDWTTAWYQRQNHEKQNSKSLKMNILRRRYGGDLQGIISKLQYLKDLGITALYFTPMQFSPSLHKYDGTNFMHIDPFLGPDALNDKKTIENENFDDFENAKWTKADLQALEMIKQAHKLGMKVVFDGVFNHIGYNSVPFQDVLKNREKSKYASWFFVDFSLSTKSNLVYEKFWGIVKEMPKLNYSSAEVKEYVFQVLKRWLKPIVNGIEYEGIDGWRIDHAIGVPMNFWKQAFKFVKTIKSDALFLGELIEEDHIIKPYLDEKCFDSVMNYSLYFSICEFFAPQKNILSALQFDKKIRRELTLFKTENNFLMFNHLGTHDTERFSSLIVNSDLKNFSTITTFFENSHINDKKYTSRCPNELEKRVQKMAIVFEFSFVGSPMIYYGDEAGMWGANDPDCRKPMLWQEMNFQDEEILVSNRHTKKYDKVCFSNDMFLFYKKIIAIRKENSEVFSKGEFLTHYADKDKRLYFYSRKYRKNELFFAFNRENNLETINIKFSKKTTFKNVFSDDIFSTDNSGNLKLSIPEVSFMVFKICE